MAGPQIRRNICKRHTPIARLLLSVKAGRGIPGRVAAHQQPAPVRHMRQQHPHRQAQGPCQMGHAGVHGNHHIHAGAQRCGVVRHERPFANSRNPQPAAKRSAPRPNPSSANGLLGGSCCHSRPGRHGDGPWALVDPSRPTPWRGWCANTEPYKEPTPGWSRNQWAGSEAGNTDRKRVMDRPGGLAYPHRIKYAINRTERVPPPK